LTAGRPNLSFHKKKKKRTHVERNGSRKKEWAWTNHCNRYAAQIDQLHCDGEGGSYHGIKKKRAAIERGQDAPPHTGERWSRSLQKEGTGWESTVVNLGGREVEVIDWEGERGKRGEIQKISSKAGETHKDDTIRRRGGRKASTPGRKY